MRPNLYRLTLGLVRRRLLAVYGLSGSGLTERKADVVT